MVLRFDKGMTEEDADRQFIQMAQNLGINIPCTTRTPHDSVADETSAKSISHPPARSCKPQPWQRVIYIDGGFDLFSAGHLNFLRRVIDKDEDHHQNLSKDALDQEDTTMESNKNFSFILVGIHSDSMVNERKGLNYPIMNLYERLLCAWQCGQVSSVIFDAHRSVQGTQYMADIPSIAHAL